MEVVRIVHSEGSFVTKVTSLEAAKKYYEIGSLLNVGTVDDKMATIIDVLPLSVHCNKMVNEIKNIEMKIMIIESISKKPHLISLSSYPSLSYKAKDLNEALNIKNGLDVLGLYRVCDGSFISFIPMSRIKDEEKLKIKNISKIENNYVYRKERLSEKIDFWIKSICNSGDIHVTVEIERENFKYRREDISGFGEPALYVYFADAICEVNYSEQTKYYSPKNVENNFVLYDLEY